MKNIVSNHLVFSPPDIDGIEKWQIEKYHIESIEKLDKLRKAKKIFLSGSAAKIFNGYKIKLIQKLNGTPLWIVDGSRLRSGLKFGDVDFTMGGHGYRYFYIPENEIWIDSSNLNTRDLWPTIWHEYTERKLMARGMDYDSAHDIAHKLEIVLREGRYFVLPVPTHRQSKPGLCGPAALKIALDYFDILFKEEEITRKLGITPKTGADPIQIVKFARSLGLKAYEKEKMTTAEVKRIIKSGIPVMANHQADPEYGEGHYALIIGFTEDSYVISDPGDDRGFVETKITDFDKKWYELEDKTVRQGIVISF